MKNLSLNKNEIHIWYFKFSSYDKIDEFTDFLSNDEKEKSQKYFFEIDKNRYIICRGVLRILLSEYLNSVPDKIKFNYNKYGKPSLKGSKNNLKFNISHSRDMCTIALNQDDDIGIDIEFINSKVDTDEIVKDFFSETEIKNYFNLEKEKRLKIFYKIWTRKESLIKAHGMGMSIPLNSFSVEINEVKPKIIWNSNQEKKENYNLYNLEICNDYCSAIVNKGIMKEIKIINLDSDNQLLN